MSWRLTAVAWVMVGSVACRRSPPPASTSTVLGDEPLPAVDAGAPPRCSAGVAVPMGDVDEAGDVVVTRDGLALGVVLRGDGGLRSAVIRVAGPSSALRVVDLGPAVADLPPPRPFVSEAGDLFAASYEAPRTLRVARIAEDRAVPMGAWVQPRDESAAFDSVSRSGGPDGPRGLVAWDEDGAWGRGAIRVATFGGKSSADGGGAPLPEGAGVVVSPRASDVEQPRLALRAGGYWVVWLARRSEGPGADGGIVPYAVEGPAEDRDARWVEALALDEGGRGVGSVRVLTAPSGHVADFDVVSRQGGAILEVFVRDETEAREGSGGRALRAVVRDGEAGGEKARVLFPTGVGRGYFTLLPGSQVGPLALGFVDEAGRGRLALLSEADRWGGGDGGVTGPPVEPALEGQRPLAFLGQEGVTGAGVRWTLATLALGAPREGRAKAALTRLPCGLPAGGAGPLP